MLGNETVFLLVLFHLLSKTEMKIIRWLGATTNPSRGSQPSHEHYSRQIISHYVRSNSFIGLIHPSSSLLPSSPQT